MITAPHHTLCVCVSVSLLMKGNSMQATNYVTEKANFHFQKIALLISTTNLITRIFMSIISCVLDDLVLCVLENALVTWFLITFPSIFRLIEWLTMLLVLALCFILNLKRTYAEIVTLQGIWLQEGMNPLR